MRIAIIRQKYTPYGGAERFVSQAIVSLIENSPVPISVSLISRQWETTASHQFQWIECNPAYFPKLSLYREKSFAAGIQKILDTHDFDIVQTHERIVGCDIFRAGDGVHASWLEARYRILPAWRRASIQLNPFHRYLLETEAALFAHPKLKYVICNSEMVKADIMARFHLPAAQLPVIYNGYNPERFSPALVDQHRQSIRQQLNIPETAPVFIFVGSGFERKGLKQAILSLQSSPHAYLIVIGQDKYATAYQRLGKEILGDRVRFLGPLKEVGPYYGAADTLLLPTLYDPFPNVIFEAMAVGLPVITTTGSGGQDLIKEAISGFVCDSLDIAKMNRAVDVLSDVSFAQYCGKNAQKTVAPLTVARMTDKLTELYQGLLSE